MNTVFPKRLFFKQKKFTKMYLKHHSINYDADKKDNFDVIEKLSDAACDLYKRYVDKRNALLLAI